MNKNLSQFSMRLDQLLGIHPNQVNMDFAGSAEKSALQIASHLNNLDFDSELAPRAGLRSKWMNQTAISPLSQRERGQG